MAINFLDYVQHTAKYDSFQRWLLYVHYCVQRLKMIAKFCGIRRHFLSSKLFCKFVSDRNNSLPSAILVSTWKFYAHVQLTSIFLSLPCTTKQLQKMYVPGHAHEILSANWAFSIKGGYVFDFSGFIQHCFICHPSDSTVSEDAGIKLRTVATLAVAVRRSNHSVRSHPQLS
jgi:hypothetical protein